MRLLALLAALQLAVTPPVGVRPAADPAMPYITAGQDEAGYRAWYAASPDRPGAVGAFSSFLVTEGISGIVPTWQLLRTATDWQRCGAEPFDVPPPEEWPHLVETLNYVRSHVIPVIGPVEPVSVYRNPVLNACAGGAPESAHRLLYAIDLVPLRPTDREGLIRGLCAIHLWRGGGYDVGLGFYKGLRFHVDSKRFRKWGGDGKGESSPCTEVIAELNAAQPIAVPPTKPVTVDPLAALGPQ